MSFRKPIEITRTSAGSYVSGTFVNGSASTITIEATIQPMKSEDMGALDMVTLPAGRRLTDFVKLYTSTNLNTVSETTGQQPDRLTWRGHTYECISVDVHQMDVIPHYKCIFVKVSQ